MVMWKLLSLVGLIEGRVHSSVIKIYIFFLRKAFLFIRLAEDFTYLHNVDGYDSVGIHDIFVGSISYKDKV